MIYTKAQLLRDAKTGTIYAEMTLRCGHSKIPEIIQGKRKLVNSNTVAIFFENKDGKQSELQLPPATLMEYTESSLTTYYPGYRALYHIEKTAREHWIKLSNSSEFIDKSLKSGGSYYSTQHRAFFRDRGMEYMAGYDELKGMRYDQSAGMVRDNKIRGDIENQYILYREV